MYSLLHPLSSLARRLQSFFLFFFLLLIRRQTKRSSPFSSLLPAPFVIRNFFLSFVFIVRNPVRTYRAYSTDSTKPIAKVLSSLKRADIFTKGKFPFLFLPDRSAVICYQFEQMQTQRRPCNLTIRYFLPKTKPKRKRNSLFPGLWDLHLMASRNN